jgi:LysR family transcriptional regulator, transcriptional activator of the cysJI operon
MTRAGISMLLHRLELQYHAQLVERRQGSILPTSAGVALYDYAKKVMQAEQHLEKDLVLARELAHGWVRIGASRTMAPHLLPPILSQFKASYPDVRVSVETGPMDVVGGMVVDGRVDFAYMMRWPQENLENVPVRRERVVIVAPSNDVPAHRRVLSREAFLRTPLVTLRNSGLRWVLERDLGDTVPARVTVATEVGDVEALVEAVRCGLGYGVMFESPVERELREGRLCEITVDGFALSTDFCLVRRRQPPLTAVAEALYNAILVAENPALKLPLEAEPAARGPRPVGSPAA